MPKDMDEVMIFGENPVQNLAQSRKLQAKQFIQDILADSSREAILVEREFLNDEDLDPKVRFQVAESILDRFLGKAAQEVRFGESEERPIIFDSRLRRLKEGIEAAVDAITHPTQESPVEAFERKVTEPDDDGGVEM